MSNVKIQKPSMAYTGASWFVLGAGVLSYFVGLWRSGMELNELGYYFTVMMFGLFSVISLQKSVRDQQEGLPVTGIYYGISWFTSILSVLLLAIGLRNADLDLSEKGFYAMSFLLSLFAVISVQKNIRDAKQVEELTKPEIDTDYSE